MTSRVGYGIYTELHLLSQVLQEEEEEDDDDDDEEAEEEA